MKSIILPLILAAFGAAGASNHKCERTYSNIGCFKENDPGMEDLVLNYRHSITWNDIESFMHSFACSCNAAVREKNKNRSKEDQYIGFALHYYGECYGRTAAKLAKLEDQKHQEHLCIGDQSYTKCIHGHHKECVGVQFAEYVYKFKNTAPKDVDGGYSEWEPWTKCQSECGPGVQVRERTCTNPEPVGNGTDCSSLGENTEAKPCMSKPCPIDGGFSDWSEFSKCTKSCGGGVQSRNRKCTNPVPSHGGSACDGLFTESQNCNIAPCPVHGGWSQWSGYDECSVKCGGGTQKRTRGCNKPEPANGGRDCEGSPTETRSCKVQPCPVNGGYTRWSTYGKCSKKCGGGIQYRSRTCTNPSPAHGGANCRDLGPNTESRPCNQQACPIKEYTTHCCEGKSVYLQCQGSDRIRIQYATYGRKTRSICKHWLSWAMKTNCRAGNSNGKLKQACEGRRTCRVYARNSVFGDPCWGTKKYLQVTYRCQ